MKGHRIVYSAAERAWIKQHCTMPRREAHARFCRRFHRHNVSLDHFKALCTRQGWRTGRTGCFAKGLTPHNLGKKMPYNPNSAMTQFKKGHLSGKAVEVQKPIGAERITRDGYLERKIHNNLPMQSRWRAVHLIKWEAINGQIPAGHCLKCIDGNRLNTEPKNWTLISRRLLPFLNGHRGPYYDQAAPEVKPVILTLAKLKHARGERVAR